MAREPQSGDQDFYVYLYSDIDGTPVYVGKGQGKRAYEHLKNSNNDRLQKWLTKREIEGFTIQPDIIAHGSESSMLMVETALISMFGRADKSKGPLFNNTDGGDGVSNPSESVRKAMSDAAYKRHGGERIFEFENVDSKETYIGNCTQFGNFIGVDVRRVNRLVSENRPGIKSLARWIVKGSGNRAAAYKVKFDFVHRGTKQNFSGTQADLVEFCGVSASAVSGLVSGRLNHANGWVIRGSNVSLEVYETKLGQWREKIKPWRRKDLSEQARQMWGIAAELFEDWKYLASIKSDVGSKTMLRSNGLDSQLTARILDSLIKKFREGFIPGEDADWVSFQKDPDVKKLLLHRQKPKGILDNRSPHKWITETDTGQNQERKKPKNSIVIRDLNFSSIGEACQHFHLKSSLVNARLRRGYSMEQAFDFEPAPSRIGANGQELVVRGINYPSEAEAARAHGVSPQQVNRRKKLGWDIEQALGIKAPPVKNAPNSAVEVVFNGIVYPSIKAACDAQGISQSTFNRRRRQGMTETEALAKTKRGR